MISAIHPMSKVCLYLVICTFRREAFVLRNLRGLKDAGVLGKDIEVLVIDNSGDGELSAKIGEMEHVRVIPQQNLGGAGGFTRGIYEVARNHGAASAANSEEHAEPYILLMDDDIEFEPEVIRRTLSLLEKSDGRTCISGQLFNIHPPHELFEAGATFGERKPFDWKVLLETSSSDDLSQWAKHSENHPIDYGGWWYFCFPLRAVAEVGLPLPLFIRGDDVDYGRRLVDAGYRIVSPEGIGVRHETFDARYGTWVFYYETRNCLILLATSYRFRGWGEKQIWEFIEHSVLKDLSRFDYGRAALKLGAIRDFLTGPDSLERCDLRHPKIVTLYNQYSLQVPSAKTDFSKRIDLGGGQGKSLMLRLGFFILRACGPISSHLASKKHVLIRGSVFTSKHIPFNTKSILFEHTLSGKSYYFEYSAKHAKAFQAELSHTKKYWDQSYLTAAQSWKDAMPTLSSFGYWGRVFGSKPIPDSPATKCQ
jgi:galactofuranosylgalactofuranosylrhamnosyl-N-acetylglucosaminyl-diphospho-decaprenol beta-1,5/1,6-galactofuranosyltransferase